MRRSRSRPPAWIPKADFIYVDVERLQATAIDDAFGEDSDPTWVKIYQNMKCHFESTRPIRAGGLAMTGAGLLSTSEYLMTFESKFDVQARDRILDADGNAYRVNDVRPYATHKEAHCDTTEID